MVFADDGDGAGVFGAVPFAVGAVVVGGVGVETGARVVWIAFARFFFFFGRRFFSRHGFFGFDRFRLFGPRLARFGLPFALGLLPCPPRRFPTRMRLRPLSRFDTTLGRLPLGFPGFHPRLGGRLPTRLFTAAATTATQQQRADHPKDEKALHSAASDHSRRTRL